MMAQTSDSLDKCNALWFYIAELGARKIISRALRKELSELYCISDDKPMGFIKKATEVIKDYGKYLGEHE